MSLITDPLYLIHISRIKFLRIDERGERIITFPPTVMSDDYVRLAAPVYPEMQYCYSPVYNNYLNNTSESYMNVALTSSPRTTRRNYHQRKPTVRPLVPTKLQESTTDSEDDDIDVDKQALIQEKKQQEKDTESPVAAALDPISPPVAETSTTNVHRSFPDTTIHPSVDSAIDPSPRFSMEEEQVLEDPTESEPVPDSSSSLEYSKQPIRRPQFASALSAMIAERATKAENPFAEYAFVSGKGEPKSIKLCVYLPHSSNPSTPVTLIVRPDAITDDVIGYILYDYVEQKRKPELDIAEYDLAEWVLLIAEDDGEIEDDLPAIDRTRTIGRVQFDQFALCRATSSQAKQNDADRARMGRTKPDLEALRKKKTEVAPSAAAAVPPSHSSEPMLPTIEDFDTDVSPTHINHMNTDETLALLINQQQHQEPDASTVAVPVPSSKATLTKATMPMTPLKYFRIKLMTNEEVSATTAIPVYAEMFIGDVLELVSRKRKLDPNEYMLTIADSNVIVPNDTSVESMRGITDLTLTKKGTQLSLPSSSTTHLWRSPIKRKKEEVSTPMYFSTTEGSSSGPSASNANDVYAQYKKYNVSRKMPMFVSKRLYILAIDGDYIHLMPPEHKGMFDSVKTSSFHASAVRSCKQSKKVPTNFKIIIVKEGNFKTYDLEAESTKEASEICNRIRLLMQITKGT